MNYWGDISSWPQREPLRETVEAMRHRPGATKSNQFDKLCDLRMRIIELEKNVYVRKDHSSVPLLNELRRKVHKLQRKLNP